MALQTFWILADRPSQAARHLSFGRVLLAAVLGLLGPGLAYAQPTTTRVSVATDGTQGNRSSLGSISADGRWVAFSSEADNLVAGDTNGTSDVFLHDQQTGTTTRVSVGPGGVQGNRDSRQGYAGGRDSLSADGRWVAFTSEADNLVAGDTNFMSDVFVHDRQTGTTIRVSVGPGSAQGNWDSENPAISADGRWVAFQSGASNLVADDTNGEWDLFVHDQHTGTTSLVSIGRGGTPANSYSRGEQAISADGRWVAFQSGASNLVADDTNGTADVFLRDRQTGTTTRVSVATGGAQGNNYSGRPAISGDGRWVAFESTASNLVADDTNGTYDVFLHDRQTGTTTRVSVGPGGAQGNGLSSNAFAGISADGRWVAFGSTASNLVADDTNGNHDAFVHDAWTGTTTRVSVATGGAQGYGISGCGTLSAGGRWVAFRSDASNLVADDTNETSDLFVHDRGNAGCTVTLAPTSASVLAAGATGRVLVLTSADCPWTAVSNDPTWLTVTGGSSGTGFGIVDYSVAPNTGHPRTGAISIGGQRLSVVQVDAVTPMAPTGLVAHTVVGSRVTLRWTIPPGGPVPTHFVLEGGLYPGQVLASIPTGTAVPTFTFEAPTGSFYARLHAVNGTVRSAASNEIRLHLSVPVAPSTPAHLLGLVHGSELALAWTNTYVGGAPTSFTLDVTGSIVTSLPVGFGDRFSFSGVPPGRYTLALRAQNEGGSSPPSNTVTLSCIPQCYIPAFPRPCSGPPWIPTSVLAYRVGPTVYIDWAPSTGGPAPTSYVLQVTGAWEGSLPTSARALSGTVAPGSYTLSVQAVNWCGASPGTVPQTVVVP